MSTSSSSSHLPLFQAIDDSIIKNINKGNYQISLLHLEQMLHEDGFLSPVNQIRHAQCLYYCKRYTEAIEVAQTAMQNGNQSKDLLFIIGMCFYQLRLFYNASQIFRQNPAWALWYKKSYIMQSFSVSMYLLPKKERVFPQKADPQVTQDNNSIILTFPYGEILRKEVKIDFYPFSVDISIFRSENESLYQTLELLNPIDPKKCSFLTTSTNLTVTLIKSQPGQWTKLFQDDLFAQKHTFQEEIERAYSLTPKLMENTEMRSIAQFQRAQMQMMGPVETRVQRFLQKEKEKE